MPDLPIVIALVALVAVLYAAVGHGGASGYLAVMALLGAAPASMKPTALVLNVLVAGVGTVRYVRAGCFRAPVLIPFALGSIPLAFVGGATATPDAVYRKVLGAVLVFAAVSLAMRRHSERPPRQVAFLVAVALGMAIGYLSGLIGVGGGIFLSPLLILTGWATTRETLGISACFILLNSVAGLAGNLASLQTLPSETPWLAVAAFAGGLLGSWLGARRLPPVALRALLAAVLCMAAAKLLLT